MIFIWIFTLWCPVPCVGLNWSCGSEEEKYLSISKHIHVYVLICYFTELLPSKRVLTCLCLAYRLINSMMLWVKIEIWNGLSGSWSGNLTYCFLKFGFLRNKIRLWIFHYFAFIFPWRRMWTLILNELLLIQIWLKLVQYVILKKNFIMWKVLQTDEEI